MVSGIIRKKWQKGVNYMKNIFNLSRIFASKKKKMDDVQSPIESKLLENNKGKKSPDVLSEKQVGKDRSEIRPELLEKRLERNRNKQSASAVTEKMLNDSNSKIIKHRNTDTASGVINKLEEQRMASGKNVPEKEKAEPSSMTEDKQLFYKVKSPDGLKLASEKNSMRKKAADMDDFDIVFEEDFDEDRDFRSLEREREIDPDAFYERYAPDTTPVLEDDLPFDIKEELKRFKEDEGVEELELDPDFLHSVFTHRTISQRDIGGTNVEQVEVEFDLRDDEGDVMEMFTDGEHIDREKVMNALLNYINLNHRGEYISADHIELDDSIMHGVGRATYFAPVA